MFRCVPRDERSILVVAGSATVSGYDRRTGERVWSVGLPEAADAVPGAIEVEVHGDRVLVLTRERLGCFDDFTGKLIGAADLGEPARAPTMLVDGGDVFVAAGRMLECYTLDCELRWRVERSSWAVPSPALAVPGNARQADET